MDVKKDTGSAEEVKETILHSYPLLDKDEIIIGIVDHDYAGLSAYGYLKNDFDEICHNTWKKHRDGEIHIVCLPIPGEMAFYLKSRHEDNFFEIEHYFGHDYLIYKNVIRETEIKNIYQVNDGRKTNFAKEMNEVEDPHVFVVNSEHTHPEKRPPFRGITTQNTSIFIEKGVRIREIAQVFRSNATQPLSIAF